MLRTHVASDWLSTTSDYRYYGYSIPFVVKILLLGKKRLTILHEDVLYIYSIYPAEMKRKKNAHNYL